MFSKDQIVEFNQTVIPFLHITSRIEGKKHDGLLREKGFGGFPSLCFMDASGEVLYSIPGNARRVDDLAKSRDLVTKMVSLKARAGEDPNAARELLVLELKMQRVDFGGAVAKAATMKLSKPQREVFETQLVEALARMKRSEAKAAVASTTLLPQSRERALEILEDHAIREAIKPLFRPMKPYNPKTEKPPKRPYHLCWDLFVAGRVPSDKPNVNTMYWRGVMECAEQHGRVDAFERALDKLRPLYGTKYVTSLEKRLGAMRAKGKAKK